MTTVAQPGLPGLPMKPAKKAPRRKRVRAVSPAAQVEYALATNDAGQRVWTLRFPAPNSMFSGNRPIYWRTRHTLTTSWREALATHAKAAKLPRGLARVRLDFVLRFPDARTDRDALNYFPLVVKPACDGFGPEFRQTITKGVRAGQQSFQPGHGLIADDTPAHLDGPYIHIGPKCADPKRSPFGEVVVTVTDLSGEVTA